ncbi:MAG TPA: hypothetical protein VN947_20500 [Polyangia bacterium]|nr:hypothetical protein [Polyangia bacterium]
MPIAQRAALFVLALACGCAATGPAPPTTPAEKPPITIAVLGLGGSDAQASAVEDGCVMALLEAGYRIVERPRVVAAIPNENDVDYTAAGHNLGADLLVDGGWTRNSGDPPRRLESRLISSHSANVLGTVETKPRSPLGRTNGHRLCAALISQLP